MDVDVDSVKVEDVSPAQPQSGSRRSGLHVHPRLREAHGKGLACKCGLSGEGARECLKENMDQFHTETEIESRNHLVCLGAFVVITYVACLRGYETYYMDLGGIRKYRVH